MKIYLLLALSFLTLSCATSTEEGAVGVDRKQYLSGVSSEEILVESQKGYAQTVQEAQKKGLLDKNPTQAQRVSAISKRLIP